MDLASQEILSQVLARLAGRGATMLIVTHELHAVRDQVAREAVVVGEGPRALGVRVERAHARMLESPQAVLQHRAGHVRRGRLRSGGAHQPGSDRHGAHGDARSRARARTS